jgi:hypothetical protein
MMVRLSQVEALLDAFQLKLNTVLKPAFHGVQFRDIGDR